MKGGNIELRIARTLADAGATVAVAESCTGGLISQRITSVGGSSRYFRGAIVAYSNAVKQRLLGVSKQVLERAGAVSEPVARRMAEGVRDALGSDYGVAVTGIAGPEGGSPEKPVGLVFVAVADTKGCVVKRFEFEGDRGAVRQAAAHEALSLLADRAAGRKG
jgi:PncC family amidohydrolase